MKFEVKGMTCGHCVAAIRRAIEQLGGEASVDLASGTVRVTGVEKMESACQAIQDAGYEVGTMNSEPEAASGETATASCCGSCHS